MTSRKDCYIQDKCKVFNQGNCVTSDEYCPKLYKFDILNDKALISLANRKRIPLVTDCTNDTNQFKQLQLFEKKIEELVEEGVNIYIYSSTTGNGKTSWAYRLAEAYISSIWYKCEPTCKVLFIDVPKFLHAIKDNISEKNDYACYIKDNVIDADLVIWDDIATKVMSEFEIENILGYINDRINQQKSNIYTTNISPDILSDKISARLASRIVNLSEVIHLTGSDKRTRNFDIKVE